MWRSGLYKGLIGVLPINFARDDVFEHGPSVLVFGVMNLWPLDNRIHIVGGAGTNNID